MAFIVSAVATVLAGTVTTASPSAGAAAKPGPGAVTAGGSPVPSQAPADPGKPLRIGISYGDTLTWKNDQDLATGLGDAVDTGSKWIRVDLSWDDIQPDSPKTYEWQRFDRVLSAAKARGLEVLPTIGYTPPWARKASCASDDACPPADPNLFAAFAAAAAKRYAPQGVHTWEVWNEPNIPFWAPAPDPAAYTQLLGDTSKALRAADPKAYILLGGLAAVSTGQDAGYVSQGDFLTAVCKLGANKMVDAISYHPYTYPYLPSAKTSFGTAMEDISSAPGNLVAILTSYGTPDLPIWITETGAATNGPGTVTDGTVITPQNTHVTEQYQATIAADTVRAAAANPHVAAVFWFTDQDTGQPSQKQQRSLFYGLRRFDGTPKPALEAWKDAIGAYEQGSSGPPQGG
ncbi:cellulase family glycosylhydrolase [Kitasatospora sp. NBC_01266]|uniref:cellulase family glycosylhydrolase n=1 Tax=Kitasatospora sp. NBC_01266 TaxID=2903572 RepID=UPI002E313E9B|nr:cellulase family glycosylhydrolase [Kitasatospora sp. NBC_01266]